MYYNPTFQVVKVNGKAGAEMYQLPPNSSVLLLDETAPLVWLKTTDGAGYPTLVPYSIEPYVEAPPVDLTALVKRIEELEEKLNDKSNRADAKRTDKSDDSVL